MLAFYRVSGRQCWILTGSIDSPISFSNPHDQPSDNKSDVHWHFGVYRYVRPIDSTPHFCLNHRGAPKNRAPVGCADKMQMAKRKLDAFINAMTKSFGLEPSGKRIRGIARTARSTGNSCDGAHTGGVRLAIADTLLGMNRKKFRVIQNKPSLKVVFLSLLLAFSAARAPGQCAGKVSSPAAVADCDGRETPREGAAIIDPVHPYTLAELIDIAEHHNPSTRTIWERAKQKARELGLAKAAYYPELDGLAVFGDHRSVNPFPKPLAPRGYVMVEVPIVEPEVTLQYLIFDFGKREAGVGAGYVANGTNHARCG